MRRASKARARVVEVRFFINFKSSKLMGCIAGLIQTYKRGAIWGSGIRLMSNQMTGFNLRCPCDVTGAV